MIIQNHELTAEDYQQMIAIWLQGNLASHSFIAPSYWEEHVDAVKVALPKAELFVDKVDDQVRGFIGLTGNAIEGLFVTEKMRRRGVGSNLMAAAKERHPTLTVHAYMKNHDAVRFYLSQGFVVENDFLEKSTNQAVYEMSWDQLAD